MHSRIIELSDQPIPADERMGVLDIPEWFTHSIADYVNANTDRVADIHWFMEDMVGVATLISEHDQLRFLEDAKRVSFGRTYPKFIEAAKKVVEMPLDEFSGCVSAYNAELKMYHLEESFRDKYGFYILFGGSLTPLEEWLRNADVSHPYYFGATFDYHF